MVQLDLLERLAPMVPMVDLVPPEERAPLAQWVRLEVMDHKDLTEKEETLDLLDLLDQMDKGCGYDTCIHTYYNNNNNYGLATIHDLAKSIRLRT